MRIVHVVEPFVSGVAMFVKSLTENLPEDLHIIIHGERRDVAAASEVRKSFATNNVRFIPWRSAQRRINLKKDWTAFLELYKLLCGLKKKNMVDAVHLHSSKSGFLGRLVCRLARIRNVIYTPNGAPFLQNGKSIWSFCYKMFERIGSALGGKIVCSSTSEKQVYEELGMKAVAINNGITIEPEVAPIASKSDGGFFTIVNSARIAEQKNPAMFNAIARQFEDNPFFRFVWVGDGEDREKLNAKNIYVTGWLPEKEAQQIVNEANIYLSTSHFEGLSFSVLEALALKKPVLLSDCVGNRDVVNKGLNGDLFASADEAVVKILQFYNNQKMLSVMGDYSHKFCRQQFNVANTSNQYQQLYAGAESVNP